MTPTFKPLLLAGALFAGMASAQSEPPAAADPAAVAALRAQFEALELREAKNTTLRQTASQETLSQIATVEQTIAANESQQQLTAWKAERLTALSDALAAEPALSLPDGLPDGVMPDIALAFVQEQTTLYAQPKVSADLTIRTLDTATTVLRIAETGAFTLIWSATDKFAFVLSQSRTVY